MGSARRGGRRWHRLLLSIGLLVPLFQPASPYADTVAPLVRIARPGIWPAVSNVIIYDGRVWFTNSQPYADNNAADVYSYHPASSALRFERGLFSQAVGIPAVVDGRLMLPFEDPRLNVSIGEYAITDGEDWRWRRLPEGTAFHTHALGRCGDELFAVTGAWEGQLHISLDNGGTWHLASIYPAKEAKFSRLIAIASWKGRCFIGASAYGRRDGKLLEWRDGELAPVAGWPVGDRTNHLVIWNDRLLALNHTGNSARLLAFDGDAVTTMTMPGSGRLRDLAADGEALWAVVSDGSNGRLWRTTNGVTWEDVQHFDEAPIAVTAFDSHVFVGTFSPGGGSLWGPSKPVDMQETAPRQPFGKRAVQHVPKQLWATLDDVISAYIEQRVGAHAGIEAVSDALRKLTTFEDPRIGPRLSERLAALDIDGRLRLFSRERTKRAHRLAWHLLGAMAVSAHGRIPLDVLNLPLSTRQNSWKKNMDVPIAAIAAAGWIEQDDRETIDVLMDRLPRAIGEPWMTSDIIAALRALTGQEFGHDIERWRSWWQQQHRR